MDVEQQVAEHYRRGGLEQAILDALKAAGKDVDRLATDDLAGADEFHLGWKPATVALAQDLALAPEMRLVDIGSGLGGPARHFAEGHRCRVEGIDLTRDFVDCANGLTARCGLADRASFRQASALAMPFADATFDRATLIHVGMNIADKAGLFAEARRVLKPGGLFGVYEVMRMTPDEIPYPMPWAASAQTSFVEPPDAYRAQLAAAGFAIEREQNRRELALALWQQMRARAEQDGPPMLGLHILMGPATPERLRNVMATLQAGTIAPVQIVARAL